MGECCGTGGDERVSLFEMGEDFADCDRAELALGWWGGYDGYDLASLVVLSHGPPVCCPGV